MSQPRRRGRWWRRVLSALIVLVVLAAAVVIGVQLVLRTDLPRRLAVQALEQATGLRVEARSLTTGWTGQSEFRDVVFHLPLDQAPIATVPVLTAEHAGLLRLLITGDLGLREVRIEGLALDVYEDDHGRWSLLRALDAVRRAQPAQSGDQRASNLPRVEISQGTIRIARPGRGSLALPLEFEGSPDSTLTWKFAGQIGDSKVAGRLTPAGWAHQVDVSVTGVGPVAALWLDQPPDPMVLAAHWSGDMGDGVLTGRLVIDDLRIAEHAAAGDTRVEVRGGALALQPGTLRIASPRLGEQPLTLSRGTITIDPKHVTAHHLRAEMPGLGAGIAGNWDIDADAVNATIAWSGAVGGEAVKHNGVAAISASIPAIGRREITVNVESFGETATQQWRARASAGVSGMSWDALDGRIAVPQLVVTGEEEPLDFSGLEFTFISRWPTVSLRELTIPRAEVTRAHATADLLSRAWELDLEVEGWTIRQLGSQPLAVVLRSSGDLERLDFSELQIATPQARITAAGSLIPARQPPLQAQAKVMARLLAAPPKQAEESLEREDERARGQEAARVPAGLIQGELEVAGTTDPIRLEARGELIAEGIRIAQGTLEPVRVRALALVDPSGARMETETFPLLGGDWKLAARYLRDQNLATAHLDARGVLLDEGVRLFLPSLIVAGELGASVDIQVPELDMQRLEVDGTWDVGRFAASEYSLDGGRGQLSYRGGRVRFHDMILLQGDAQLTGQVEFDAADPRRLVLDMASRRWPVRIAETDVRMLVDSEVKVEVDTIDRGAQGTVAVNADASLAGVPLGRITADTRIAGRTVHADRIEAGILGGTMSGHGVVPIDEWVKSKANLRVQNMDLANLGELARAMGDLRGVISGEVTVGPATDERSLEPLRMEAALTIDGGSHRGMDIGDVRLVGYAGPRRVMLDRSEIDIAGGTVSFWSRLSWHGDQPFVHVSLETTSLDLEQLVRAADPEIGPTPGRVNGRAAFGGYVHHPHRAYGEAVIALRDSELGRLPVISQLYGLLNLDFGDGQPSGQGVARLRLEGDALQLQRLQYYNRGADVVAHATVENIWQGGKSPIDGVAAAAIRPLKNSRLPFGAELDRVLLAVFTDAASVQVTGTLEDRKVEVVPFSQISDVFQRMLGRAQP